MNPFYWQDDQTTGSEQCNDQEHEDRPSCMQVMKKLFFSLVLGTVIAICWVMIIHTLKWIAIKGSESELLLQHQQQQQQQQQHHQQHQHHNHQQQQQQQQQNIHHRVQQEHTQHSPQHHRSSPGELLPAFALSAQLAALSSEPGSGTADNDGRTIGGGVGVELGALGGGGGGFSELTNSHSPVRRLELGETIYSELRLQQMLKVKDKEKDKEKVKEKEREQQEQQHERAKKKEVKEVRLVVRQTNAKGDKPNEDEDDNSAPLPIQAPQLQLPVASSFSSATTSQSASSVARNIHQDSHLLTDWSGASTRRQQSMLRTRPVTATPPWPSISSSSSSSSSDLDRLESSEDSLKSEASFAADRDGGGLADTSGGQIIHAADQTTTNNLNNQFGSANQPNLDERHESLSEMAATSAQQQIERSISHLDTSSSSFLYKAPFFTSWFVSIWNILFMPIFTIISSCCFRNEDNTTKKLLVESISQFMDNGLTTLQFLGRCAFFSVVWLGTIFGIVYSLSNIDATVVMALYACSAALMYLLSWVLLHQQFVGVRIVAVIICTTGVALLAYMDNSRTLGSVLIVAGSALCSAVYKVIYQRMFGFWSIAQMSLFFTLIGLFIAFLMWPIALLLYFFGVELIVWRHIPWMHLTAAGALHLTANIVAYFGPICSYDIFLTMGLLLAVVLSAAIDVTFYQITFVGMKLAGVLLLMIGFLVCLLPENWNEFLYDLVNERFVRWKKQRSLKKSRNKVQDLSTGQTSRLRTPSGRVK